MAINSGVNISKALGYAVLSPPAGVSITKALGFAVLNTPSAPVWPGTVFPNGTLNVAYSSGIDIAPSTPPITFALFSGALPTGTSLSQSGTIVTISGTPTATGTFSFVLSATNSYGSVNKSFSITISSVGGTATVWIT